MKSKSGDSLDDFVNESEGLIKQINDELIQPIFKKSDVEQSKNSLLVHSSRPVPPYRQDDNHHPYSFDPLRGIGRIPSVGAGDLDPFGREGGGMIFQPRPFMPFRGPGGSFG